jgi:hypothetical protein
LFAALYEELRHIARRELRRSGGLTLSATTLLHEAYLKVQRQTNTAFPDQTQFLGYAARVMRNLVIDYARHGQAQKRGGAFEITSLPTLVKAEKLARKLGDPAQIASVQCNTVETELQASRPQLAAERMRDGLANLAKVADPSPQTQIVCETAQARLLWGQGDTPQAISVARKVALFMEANHQDRDIRYNTVVSMLEVMFGELGSTREALQWNRRGIAALERSGRAETLSMSWMRHNQAAELADGGDIRGAYEDEEKLAQQIVGHEGPDGLPPTIAHRLGFLKVRIEETDAGLVWIERAVHQAAMQHNPGAQIGALISRARAELILGQRERVLPDVEQAERLVHEPASQNAAAVQNAHLIRAQLLVAQGNALASLGAISALLVEFEYPAKRTGSTLPAALILRSRAESMLGRHTEALQTAREALAVSEERALDPDQSADVGAAQMSLADAQLALGDAAGARSSARRASTTLSRSLGPTHSETRAADAFAMRTAATPP